MMNVLRIPAAVSVVSILLVSQGVAEVNETYESHEFAYTGGPYEDHAFPYRLMRPEGAEEGEKYPLVVFLHGAGERGDDNEAQLQYLPTWMAEPDMRERHPAFLLAPQCPEDRRWTSINWSERDYRYADDLAHELRAVVGMIERVMEEHPIDPDRVYLTGLSMGGYGSWELAARRPDLFAAVAPICGGGDVAQVDGLAGLPIWAWHGGADGVVPAERSRQMIEAIREAGGEPKYTELPGVGHDSWTPAYTREDGVVPWLFEQVRGR